MAPFLRISARMAILAAFFVCVSADAQTGRADSPDSIVDTVSRWLGQLGDVADEVVPPRPNPLGSVRYYDPLSGKALKARQFEDNEVLHVTMPRVHWLAKLRMLGEDDAESRLNDYETYGELVIDETGERGFGQFEHSTLPPDPRWLR